MKSEEGERKNTLHMFRFDLIAVLAASIKSEHIFDFFLIFTWHFGARFKPHQSYQIKNEYEENDRGSNAKHNKILVISKQMSMRIRSGSFVLRSAFRLMLNASGEYRTAKISEE